MGRPFCAFRKPTTDTLTAKVKKTGQNVTETVRIDGERFATPPTALTAAGPLPLKPRVAMPAP